MMQNQGFGPKMIPEISTGGRWIFPHCEGTAFWFASFSSEASALAARAMYFLALENAQLEIIENLSEELKINRAGESDRRFNKVIKLLAS